MTVSKFDFPAHYTVEKFGHTPDIDAGGANEDVWDGTDAYGGFLAAAVASKISSSSGDDTATGPGTGALTVRVQGLDANYKEFQDDLTMAGQTGVSLTTTPLRVNRAYVLTAGTGGTNAGDIWVGSGTITSGVPANKYAGIQTGLGQTLMAIYTIPQTMLNGDTVVRALIHRWYASVGAVNEAQATLALQTRSFGGAWRTRRLALVTEGGNLDEDLSWGFIVAPKTDIRVRAISNVVNNTQIAAGFDIAIQVLNA